MDEKIKQDFLALEEKFAVLPKGKKYFVEVDDDGNVKGYFPIKPKSLGKRWFAMFQDPALWIGQLRLTGEQYSVLFALFHKLDFDNYLRVARQEIADALNIKPANVSRAMKKLKEVNIIVEGPPAGKFKTYRLNPYVAFKGKERKEAIMDFEENLEKQGKNILDASKFF